MEEPEEDEDQLDFLVLNAITSAFINNFEDDNDDADAQVCDQPNVSKKQCRRLGRKVMWTNKDGT